jgi:C_GCAxxG_C_C family probable redox protein
MMDAKEIEKRAEELFGSGLYCAESVLLSVAEHAGIASPLIPKIATGFCGGMSRTRGMCGAVNGGVMALGLLFGRNNPELPVDAVYGKVQQFLNTFHEEYGSINCFELIGVDLGTERGREQFKQMGIRSTCRGFTGGAARMVAEIIQGEASNETKP